MGQWRKTVGISDHVFGKAAQRFHPAKFDVALANGSGQNSSIMFTVVSVTVTFWTRVITLLQTMIVAGTRGDIVLRQKCGR